MKLKSIKCLFLLTIFLLSCINAYSMEDFSIINENFTKEELPLSFVSKGLPIVEIKIEDQIYNLILDTGADSVAMAFVPSAINRLNPQYLINQKQSLDINGNSYQERQFKLSQVSIGNLKIANLICSEELRDFVPKYGIIGNQFLKHFNVYLDYENLKVILYPKNINPSELELEKWHKVSFEHNHIGIVLNGKFSLNKKKLKFCLDTGMCSIDNGKTYGWLKPKNMPGLFNKKKIYESNAFYVDVG